MGQEPPHDEFDELMERLGMVHTSRPVTDAEVEERQRMFEATRLPGGRRHNDPPLAVPTLVDPGLRRILMVALALAALGGVLCLLLR